MSGSQSLLHSMVSLTRAYWNVYRTCAALHMMLVYFPDENSIIIMFFTYCAHLVGWRTTVVMLPMLEVVYTP